MLAFIGEIIGSRLTIFLLTLRMLLIVKLVVVIRTRHNLLSIMKGDKITYL